MFLKQGSDEKVRLQLKKEEVYDSYVTEKKEVY